MNASPSAPPPNRAPSKESPPVRQPPRLLDQLRHTLRVKHYAYKTEKSYVAWVRDYVVYHGKRHPREMGGPEIQQYLTHLAVQRRVAASTQNQALCAIVFLYRHVLGIDLGDFRGFAFAKKPKRLPVVLTVDEVEQIVSQLHGTKRLMVELLYGTGMRLTEVLRLRVKDLDFNRQLITVRDAKGNKDRGALLPESLIEELKAHIAKARTLHQQDLAAGYGTVHLPYALEQKYPNAHREFGWQYVFPSGKLSTDPLSGRIQRHHVYDNFLQKVIRQAVRNAGIDKPVRAHTFRHSFATHLLEAGNDIRTIQDLLGHKSVDTTMIYTHVIRKGHLGVTSPTDTMHRRQANRLAEPPQPAVLSAPPSCALPSPVAAAPQPPQSPSAGKNPSDPNHPPRVARARHWLRRAALALFALVASGDWRP